MKKFLSLVLALVMTMSLVTISAGAKDFTDDSTIDYKEAVDVISALDIVEGYPDGSFGPSKGLTRAEAAKIICNMILGPTTASALVADAAPFKDVPVTHWAAGYIAFCTKEGIIDGYGDGNFGPGDDLTGYAYMKLLLGALGYDKDIEGYTGPNWSINVAKRALNIGLDDGLGKDKEFNGVKVVTRQEAVLYAFNTLTADMVEYGNKTTVTVGGAEVVVGAGEAKTITLNHTKDYRESERADANGDNKQQFCEKYFSKLTLKDASGATDDFGRPANTWYKKNDRIGTYAKEADKVYYKSVAGKDIFKDLGMDKNDAYYFDVVVDGFENTDAVMVNKTSTTKLSSVGTVGTGSLVQVFEDEQVVTVVNTYIMQVDGDYDEKDEELDLDVVSDGLATPLTLSFANVPLSSDDFAGLDEYKDGDIVVVTAAYNGANYDIKTIAPAESVTATVTEYVDKDTVTADGKERSYNITAAATDDQTTYQYALKEEATLYLDAYGNVLWAKGVEAEDNYVYIVDFSAHTTSATRGDVEAYGYFLDGTDDGIALNKVNGTKVAGTTGEAFAKDLSGVNGAGYGWYRYTKKDNGKYDLNKVFDTAITARNVTYDGGVTYVDVITDYESQKTDLGVVDTYYGNKTTKFIIVDEDGDVSVYEGIKNAPKTIVGAGYIADAVMDGTSDYAKYVFIDVTPTGKVDGGAASGDLLYILKLDATYGHDSDADTYYRYKAILNGEEKKVKVESSLAPSFGLYTDVEYTSKGYVTDLDPVSNGDDFSSNVVTGMKVTYKNNTVVLSVGASKLNYYLADNCTIYLITDDDTVEKISASKLAKEYGTTAFTPGSTIHGVKNAEDEFTALYVNVQ